MIAAAGSGQIQSMFKFLKHIYIDKTSSAIRLDSRPAQLLPSELCCYIEPSAPAASTAEHGYKEDTGGDCSFEESLQELRPTRIPEVIKDQKQSLIAWQNTAGQKTYIESVSKMLIFLSTSVAIDSDGLKVIRTCGLLCAELVSGMRTSKQCNRIFCQRYANFKSFPFEVLISIETVSILYGVQQRDTFIGYLRDPVSKYAAEILICCAYIELTLRMILNVDVLKSNQPKLPTWGQVAPLLFEKKKSSASCGGGEEKSGWRKCLQRFYFTADRLYTSVSSGKAVASNQNVTVFISVSDHLQQQHDA
ncbi:hypothetical protein F2P81_005691 [Scophthalmus maximus]|uniref:Uncharacterized protein n=1 Tax=Scophthalmus maximus TaxID=52904 RepID=A0A6A4TB86_SCOMX|nr:hypothetical protein F2P81_005691 [Scophthalmus maximus]